METAQKCVQDPRDVPRKYGYALQHKDCYRSDLSHRNHPCASVHMASKSNVTPEEQDTLWKSKESCAIITANGSITTTEEATAIVYEKEGNIGLFKFQVSKTPQKHTQSKHKDKNTRPKTKHRYKYTNETANKENQTNITKTTSD